MAVNQERGHVPLSVYHSKHSIPRAILFLPCPSSHVVYITPPLFSVSDIQCFNYTLLAASLSDFIAINKIITLYTAR
jgi:hypothetical protein